MPNWCFNRIRIRCPDNDMAENLYNKLTEWTSFNYRDSDFSLSWLGNVVGNSGIDAYEGRDFTKYSCRGSLDEFTIDENEITVFTSTAWSPMIQMWKGVCDKYCPEAEILYDSEECCNGIYQTNDKELAGKYYLDSGEDELESDMDYSEQELIKTFQEYFKSEEDTLEYYEKLIEEDELYIGIHKWEYVPIEECE